MDQKVREAVVVISYVKETVTRGGLRRFEIGAEREGETLADRYLSFTTLNEWKASLCDRHRISGQPLAVKYRNTGYFDYDLLWVGPVRDEQEQDGDPERDRAAQAALEHWQRGPRE